MALQMIEHGSSAIRAFFSANAVGFNYGTAIRFKHGVLSPGAYINNRTLQSCPLPWDSVLGPFLWQAILLRDEYDVVASVASGGVPHGTVLARERRVPHFTVKKQEKGHGLSGLIDGDERLLRGARVLMVEDMSSTFESTLKAMRPLQAAGATIAHTLTLNTWNFPEFRRNTENHSVFTLCTGRMFLDHAASQGGMDDGYARIVRRWLENPEDQSWAYNGSWKLPE